jgi:hypothetical protein
MYGFHRERNTELSDRRPMKEDIRSHTIEDEEWKYENNLPKRLDSID